jgi:hypothetical protein
LSIALAVIAAAAFFFAAEQLQRSPYTSWRGVARTQPVPFSHQHHVGGLGIEVKERFQPWPPTIGRQMAASHQKFPRNAGGDLGSVRLLHRVGGPCCTIEP